ncbi:sugar phosphate nucleotidyltransferase [Acetivibrio straminisolvens]|jgi:mannose-1-phosphate guanylyltransferase|uniref:Mannose-1-phosphate guanylyltransferase n=1 Tax=Acetivibrio straminisolvens JCM 21531 TaxID=1294263 RepID=W4V493_9FIRM|nr:NDP-sugar synthase [Acetivibrio straminisolvens]GAE87947.1 mannose-1-phosphate guanylyltransferase [Acetivibrio straminisolvens JCM 21531]
MKALFLAGGFGTRLRPITNDLPKPMVPIMGKPLLERNIERLKSYGIDEIVLSTCYKPHKIDKYFEDGEKFGAKINYITEEEPLGTAGAIKNAEKFLSDTFLVFNADILSDIDIADMIRFHKEKGAMATIAVTRVDNPSAYGVIEHDDDSFITAFKEKPKPHESKSNLINAGVYIFEREILNHIPGGRAVSIERETYPLLLEKGFKMAVYDKCSYWLDLGTPGKYLKVHKDILKGLVPIGNYDFGENRVFISESAKVDRSANIRGPVYIGENVVIGPSAVVGPNTVLFDNAFVGVGAKVEDSVVWDNVNVEKGAKVMNSVIMSNCTIDKDSERCNSVLTENSSHPIAV